MEANRIQLSGIGKRYGDITVLSDVHVAVRAGEILAVVGPDGAGKTTLMQILAGILSPSTGQGTVLGHDLNRSAERVAASVGYMSQGFTLYDQLTVLENIAFSAGIRGLPDSLWQQRAVQLLDMAGLSRFTARRAGALSGGMRKKLSLCCNLIHEPQLLILDEPGLGVDPLSRRDLWRILMGYRSSGVSIVVATSYLDEADACDHVLLLAEGRTVGTDTPAALKARCNGRVYEWPLAQPSPLPLDNWRSHKQLVDRHHVVLRERPVTALPNAVLLEPSLEDVFVDLTGGNQPNIATGGMGPAHSTRHALKGISVVALTIRFGAFTAVDAASVSIEPGKIVAFLGPNGAGKTTLIRSLCGLQKPSSGHATVAGFDVRTERRALRAHIGYMSQHFSLYPDLTAQENLDFFASAYGMDRRAATAAIAWACAVTELVTDDHFVRDMSGATRQRLALACSLLHRPAVLFLDEPTSGVDPQSRYRFWSVIQQLAATGVTIVVTTHYLAEAEYCHRICLMHNGHLFADGTLPQLCQRFGLAADSSVEELFIAGIAAENANRDAA
ncbi:ABC transporter ATP-binding protein [Permianibacter sp. IMCC34836]|uniref:ATP-binding cassette domain-containing protein n=1 Tax=Permianibacter fluminis TaxID=2738515 RepID=UPI001551BAD9|nr:ATP-binding cassette domain-containing protein [Permianibacter fluminis]NQD37966.1 ABC transporter ATP-binding protein [Permianibacter fluminis]